jgi:hypothetical protein
LLQSLAFTLEVHGMAVTAFDSWAMARQNVGAASCVILDGCLPLADRQACLEQLPEATGVIILAEAETRIPQRALLEVVDKPLSGPDILAAVAHYV